MASTSMKISMVLSVLIGAGYVGWLAWAEGWRLWVVVGGLLLVAGIGGLAHLAMGLARDRDGLEIPDEDSAEEET